MRLRLLLPLICAATLATACAGTDPLPNDPFEGAGPALVIVPVNHTDRYAYPIFVDTYWAGNIRAHSGGAGGVCCYPGLKDWGKPVKITWTWGWEEDKKTGKVVMPDEEHTAVVYFPPGGPKRSNNMFEDEAYLCVIFRDFDKVELAFSINRTGCTKK